MRKGYANAAQRKRIEIHELNSEDRQVQSIDDQLTRLNELSSQRGLNIVATYTEAKSAKLPGQRLQFDQMVSTIEAGKADAILCWQLNRLSRNPVESGKLSWLLQRGVIQSIMTVEREYRPEDNVLLFSVESGMANQYILDLSRNIKRGIQGKLERGELPCLAPPGYLNDKLARTVIADPDRFGMMKQAWDMLLTGNYSVAQIKRELDAKGFRTVQRSHSGGNPISLSVLHKAFANPFYAGLIRSRGREYAGNQPAMVTLSEFERAQGIFHRTDQPRRKKYLFCYSRTFICGECSGSITAEHKRKRSKASGKMH